MDINLRELIRIQEHVGLCDGFDDESVKSIGKPLNTEGKYVYNMDTI